MKRNLCAILILITLLLFCSCSIGQQENTEQYELYIRLSSPYSSSYFFFVGDNGTFRVAKGMGSLDDWMANDINVLETEDVQLDDLTYREIMQDIDSLGDFLLTERTAFDVWEVDICLNGTKENFVFGYSKNPNYDTLVEKLIELSPLDVVDNFGNKAKPLKY